MDVLGLELERSNAWHEYWNMHTYTYLGRHRRSTGLHRHLTGELSTLRYEGVLLLRITVTHECKARRSRVYEPRLSHVVDLECKRSCVRVRVRSASAVRICST